MPCLIFANTEVAFIESHSSSIYTCFKNMNQYQSRTAFVILTDSLKHVVGIHLQDGESVSQSDLLPPKC